MECKTTMHYDLDFLNKGNVWKPKEDAVRLNMYKFAREEFELTPEDMVMNIVPKGLLDLKDYNEFAGVTRLLAYPRLMTLKTADMVIGEAPNIEAQVKDDTSEKIKDMRNRTQLDLQFKQAVIDYSRFGVLLIRVFKDDAGNAALTAWDPNEWVPVFYPDGTRRIHYNVIGWFESEHKLKLQIHDTSNGQYEERTCSVDDTNTITSIDITKTFNKESGKKLLFAVPNTPTTTNPLGTNDYLIINGLLQKAIERLTAILRVLDEHADPSMTGPSSLLTKTDNGELVFKTNKYYAIGDDEKEPKYLVWEANLESSFIAFEKLCEQIYILSEMGAAFLGASSSTGNVVSGTAMRFKMISPLEKARRITNDLTQPLKEIISSMLSIEKVKCEAKDINVAWKDSLPKDPRELVELTKLESGTVAIKPLLHALMDNFGIDEDTAKSYIDGILKEQEQFSAVNATNTIDGKSHGAGAKADPREKGSKMNPTDDQNIGGAENSGK